MRRRNLLFILGASLMIGSMASSTRAAVLIAFDFVGSVPVPGGFQYSYNVTLAGAAAPNNNALNSGDYFSLYDFNGLFGTPTFTPTAGFVGDFSSVNTGGTTPFPIAQGAGITDKSGVPNLAATYTGSNFVAPPSGLSIPLGTLVADSIFKPSSGTSQYYAAQDHKADQSLQGNSGFLVGPGTVVPVQPASLGGGLLLGLLGLGKLAKSRRLFA